VAASVGPLLEAELAETPAPSGKARYRLLEGFGFGYRGAEFEYDLSRPAPSLPVLLHLAYQPPRSGEPWSDYRTRAAAAIEPVLAVASSSGHNAQALVAANAVLVYTPRDAIDSLLKEADVEHAELNATLRLAALDDVPRDIDLPSVPLETRLEAGTGAAVAVLDSGIDTRHPALEVAESVSVCEEDVAVAGTHGTFCAGIIASRDPIFTGVAPGVRLINVKTVSASNRGEPGAFARGIDAALDRHADIISASLGANHLPRWSDDGEGWYCPADALCVLCRAVRSAVEVSEPPAFVVAAAGNWHVHAEHLREKELAGSFDTEICCPGQSSAALTVGSIAKSTYVPAPTSSYGPTSYGGSKPDICADGVNITSTVPAPRDAAGEPKIGDRSTLFARDSGTSAATAVVAGIAARIVAEQRAHGIVPTPATIRSQLLLRVAELPYPAMAVGAGRTRV
jgi:serine protease AprX